MFAYPFTVLTFVLVYVAAYFIFGERITATGITGVLLVLFGMLLIVRAS
jgi:drug/metabolite transporter (DMT)-like permease